jgi:hypothetical protein
MANKIKLRRSYTSGAVPLASDLDTNECCVNWADGKLFVKNSAGNIVSVTLGGGGSSLSWSSVPASATATGTAGQIAYDSQYQYVCIATNTWSRTPISNWSNWVPTSVSNCQLWLDASDASSLYDATSGGSLVASGGMVKRWQDKSGNSRHATEGTSGPTRVVSARRGLDVVRFGGTNTLSFASSTSTFNFLHNATGGAVFAVYKVDAAQGTCYLFANCTDPSTGSANGSGTLWRHDTDSGTSRYVAISLNADSFRLVKVGTAGSFPAGSYEQVTAQFTLSASDANARHNVRRKGVDITATDNLGNTDTASLLTGSASASMYLFSNVNGQKKSIGDLCEIIMYSGTVSSADRSTIESYLISKWGVI